MAFADYGRKAVDTPENVEPKLSQFHADRRPAILNQVGTLGPVAWSERPRPEKKKRVLPRLRARKENSKVG